MSVLDVGTGSGILARAARLLGAGKVYACDTDPVAVEIAGGGFIGSADAVAAGSCDLVAANISPEAIVGLAPDLVRVLRPGGVLLASGFELQEVEPGAGSAAARARGAAQGKLGAAGRLPRLVTPTPHETGRLCHVPVESAGSNGALN
jgi:ribosomal protein L11 methyltransferase